MKGQLNAGDRLTDVLVEIVECSVAQLGLIQSVLDLAPESVVSERLHPAAWCR